MRGRRFAALLVAAGLVALGVAACGGGGEDEQAGGAPAAEEGGATGAEGAEGTDAGASGPAEGSVAIAIGSEPTTLDPQLRDDGGERAVSRNIYETLMTRTEEGELEPGLAAEPPTLIDDTTWQVKLRDGISFTNGEPLNADAVVASVERIIDPEFNSEQVSFVSSLAGAEKVDDLTVNITTSGPDPILPSRLYWLTIVPPEASQSPDFADNPVGTGPYVFKEWAKGDHITLEANPDYWGEPKPAVAEAVFRFVPEGGTRVAGLLSGDFDLITNLLPEDTERVPKFEAIESTEHPVFILDATSGAGLTGDVNVRRALNYAIDKEALAQSLFGGFAEIDNCQILSPSFFGYNESLEPYPYDPEQAQQLIQDAGAAGQALTIVGESGRWLKDRELIEAVSNYWREAGLEVQADIYDFDEYLNRLFDTENREDAIFVVSSNELLDADRQLSAFYSSDGVGDSNEDEELLGWITEARSETDEAARKELYAQATQRACDEAYFAFLLNIQDIYGLSERLEYQPRQDGLIFVKTMAVNE